MKISKITWIILGIGIFVLAAGSLYWLYHQQSLEQRQLDDSLAIAQAALPKMEQEKEVQQSQLTQLESQLTQAESDLSQAESVLNESQANFPEAVESIEFDERLFKLARDRNLEITMLTASKPSSKAVGGINFSVTSFTVSVSGDMVQILEFIGNVVKDKYFVSATVESVSMKITEEEPSASIALVIYGY